MSKLSRILITIFISLTVFNCKSQNLILNGSFENYTNIDCTYGGFWNATMPYPYPSVLDNWEAVQSPDYFNRVCPYNSLIPGQFAYQVPANMFGYSQPKTGNAYVGIVVYTYGGYREYFYQNLSSPLIAGHTYCLNYYAIRTDRCQYAIKNIDAYFTPTLPNLTTSFNIPATPQITNQTGFVSDTMQWTQIQGCYTATGGEKFMIIGNFKNNVNTDTLYAGTNNPDPNYPGSQYNYSYYFFDDITLVDQVTVGLNSIADNTDFKLYPNPTTGLINFSDERYSEGDCNVKVLDIFGKELIDEVLNKEIDISAFDKGVYTLLLYKNKQLVVTKKVMKN